MRKFTIFLAVLFLIIPTVQATHFKAEDEIVISSAEFGDYYLAGDDILIETVLMGDLIAAAGNVVVEDSIHGDLLIAAGRVTIRGYIADDARITSGEVIIDNIIEGDLVVFAGKVRLTDRGMVKGNVISFSGELSLYGEVRGNVYAKGGEIRLKNTVYGNVDLRAGEIDFDGHVMGDIVMAGEEIEVGNDAYCEGAITYWNGKGELNLSKVSSSVRIDDSMAMIEREIDWSVLGLILGVGFIAYCIIFVLSAFLILLLLEKFWSNFFSKSATALKASFIKSFGYGMIYFIGFPLLILLLFIIIIGIPIAAAGLSIYLASMLFASTLSGLCLTHYLKNRSNAQWSFMQTVGYALLTVVILKIIFMIPLLGTLIKTVVVGGVYGSFLLVLMEKNKTT